MKTALRYLLSAMMITAGILHFARPEKFVAIVPDWLPAHRILVAVSGFFEVLGGVGLLVKRVQRAAAWGLAALFVAVFPANVNMAVNRILIDNPWILWGRLPFQAVLVLWAWWLTRPDRESRSEETK
jgi:uncharacterized membrane protein